jgi:hypothetical protein
MRSSLIVSVAVLSALSVSPALALDDDRWNGRGISRAEAVWVARSYGLVRVEEVEHDDGGWEIEGRDRRGREIEIEINRTGRVTEVDRDDDWHLGS